MSWSFTGFLQGGLAISNLCEGAVQHHQSSLKATELLMHSLLNVVLLDSAEHWSQVRKARPTARIERIVIGAMVEAMGPKVKKWIEQMESTGSWLANCPNCFDGTDLASQEFFGNIKLRYEKRPKELCDWYNDCSEPFLVQHALSCKCGGLVGI